jgi:hypothetical protein
MPLHCHALSKLVLILAITSFGFTWQLDPANDTTPRVRWREWSEPYGTHNLNGFCGLILLGLVSPDRRDQAFLTVFVSTPS